MVLDPPTNLSATDIPGAVVLTWSPAEYESNAYFAGYNIYIAESSIVDIENPEEFQYNENPYFVNSVEIGDLQIGKTYYMHIRSVSDMHELSDCSEEIAIENNLEELHAPSNLKISATSNGKSLLLSWSACDVESPTYNIYFEDSLIASDIVECVFLHDSIMALGQYEVTASYSGFESEAALVSSLPVTGQSDWLYFMGDTVDGFNCYGWDNNGNGYAGQIEESPDFVHIVFELGDEHNWAKSAHFYLSRAVTYFNDRNTYEYADILQMYQIASMISKPKATISALLAL